MRMGLRVRRLQFRVGAVSNVLQPIISRRVSPNEANPSWPAIIGGTNQPTPTRPTQIQPSPSADHRPLSGRRRRRRLRRRGAPSGRRGGDGGEYGDYGDGDVQLRHSLRDRSASFPAVAGSMPAFDQTGGLRS